MLLDTCSGDRLTSPAMTQRAETTLLSPQPGLDLAFAIPEGGYQPEVGPASSSGQNWPETTCLHQGNGLMK